MLEDWVIAYSSREGFHTMPFYGTEKQVKREAMNLSSLGYTVKFYRVTYRNN